MRDLKTSRAAIWAHQELTTIGQVCRAVAGETLRNTLERAMLRQSNDNSQQTHHVVAQLGLT